MPFSYFSPNKYSSCINLPIFSVEGPKDLSRWPQWPPPIDNKGFFPFSMVLSLWLSVVAVIVARVGVRIGQGDKYASCRLEAISLWSHRALPARDQQISSRSTDRGTPDPTSTTSRVFKLKCYSW